MFAVFAPGASAVVFHGLRGHRFGVTLHRGIKPASLPGSVASAHNTSAQSPATQSSASDTGVLTNQGGPVLHSSSPYLVYWDPSGSYPTGAQNLLKQYFTDVAAASGQATNVYGVSRQYTDGAGFADYQQKFAAGSQVITDTQSYPSRDSTCADSPVLPCLSDAQIQAELQRLIAADHLPADPVTSSEFASGAPVYFVVLPTNANACLSSSDGSISCASNSLCSWHSAVTGGGSDVLYAVIPTEPLASSQSAKACQNDGNSAVQQPNLSLADVALKLISHEDSEVITDPLLGTWYDKSSGEEVGDNCNATGPVNYAGNTNPNAFLPTLGGSASAGSLYDQAINGDHYYLQSEWSNGDRACEMQPSGAAVTPQFTPSVSAAVPGTSFSFDPSGSSAAHGISSSTWSFGDGGTPSFKLGAPSAVSHTYSASGHYTATLMLVDGSGDLASVAHQILIYSKPVASFTSSSPVEGAPVSFDGSGSSDPDPGVGISSYSWNFGDKTGLGTGAKPSHTYAAAGTYSVQLTVTNSVGMTGTSSQQITVADETPTASFSITPTSTTPNQPVTFDGTSSSDPDGTIKSYSWNWGDGTAAGTGGSATHSYATAGVYLVTLTVTDSAGVTGTLTQSVTVGPIPKFTVSSSQPYQGTTVFFDGTPSIALPGSSLTYSWDFGDGSTASGAKPSHVYSTPGTYTASLTVTNDLGQTAQSSQTITVMADIPTAVFTAPSAIYATYPASFDGTSSSDPGGLPLSYDWSFGDGSTDATTATASHTYAASGTYKVNLTVTNAAGQTSEVSKTVTVTVDAPSAGFTIVTSPAYAGASVSFSGVPSSDPAGSALTYDWSFGDGSSDASTENPSHVFTAPGNYTISLTVTNTQKQTSTTTKSVNVVVDTPAPAFSVPSVIYAGYPASFDGTGSSDPAGSALIYAWTYADGSGKTIGTDTAPISNFNFQASGTYTVTLAVTNDSKVTKQISKTVSVVNDVPAASIAITSSAYVGEPVTFDAGGSSDPAGSSLSYAWSFDGTPSTANSATTTQPFATAGSHTVSLTVTNAQKQTNTTTRTFTVSPDPPTASFVTITAAVPLAGQAIAFDGTGSRAVTGWITSYAWNFRDGSTAASGPTTNHTFASPGTYIVSLTVTDSNGETGTVSQPVTVHAPPTASFTFSPAAPVDRTLVTFSGGGSFNPDASTAITSYAWNFGDGTIGSGPTTTHRYASPGRYLVQLTVVNNLGLTNTTSQAVTVGDESPSAAIALTTARPASGQPVAFTGASSNDPDGSIVSYRWDFGDGSAATRATIAHTYAKAGSYTVKLTVTDSSGQSATTSRSVTVALSGRIVKTSLQSTRTGANLLVTVNTPGTVKGARRTVHLSRAATAKLRITLTAGQLRTMLRTHRLSLSFAVRFIPTAGPQATRTVSVIFRPPRVIRGRLAAVLRR